MTLILDNGHGVDTKGKCSPDKSFYEWEFARKVVAGIAKHFRAYPYESIGLYHLVPEDTDISLNDRVARVNDYAERFDPNSFLVSVHVNASGTGTSWLTARGWESHCCLGASEKSHKLANCFWDVATTEMGLKTRRPLPTQNYWENNYYILKRTTCPAILTENFFMDNQEDCNFLKSEQGLETVINLHVAAICKYLDWPYTIITPRA